MDFTRAVQIAKKYNIVVYLLKDDKRMKVTRHKSPQRLWGKWREKHTYIDWSSQKTAIYNFRLQQERRAFGL